MCFPNHVWAGVLLAVAGWSARGGVMSRTQWQHISASFTVEKSQVCGSALAIHGSGSGWSSAAVAAVEKPHAAHGVLSAAVRSNALLTATLASAQTS